jgi:hypothetical protein
VLGTPAPESDTAMPPSGRTATTTLPPAGEWPIAFSIRLTIACDSDSSSAGTFAGSLARISYPGYARDFAAATQNLQNRTLGQFVAKLMWSPIPDLDVGVEYSYAERGLLARSSEGARRGVGQRLLFTVTYRF